MQKAKVPGHYCGLVVPSVLLTVGGSETLMLSMSSNTEKSGGGDLVGAVQQLKHNFHVSSARFTPRSGPAWGLLLDEGIGGYHREAFYGSH